MFDPYRDASPQIDDETFTDPVGAVKKRLAQLELARQQRTPPDQPTPGWEGVRPEVDARNPDNLRPRQPPTIHMPEDPALRMMPAGAPVQTSGQPPPEPPAPAPMAPRPASGGPGLSDLYMLASRADADESRRRRVSDALSSMLPHGAQMGGGPSHANVEQLSGLEQSQGLEAQRKTAAEASDPASATSQRARSAFKAMQPGAAAKLGAMFEQVPASALPGWKELIAQEPKPRGPEQVDLDQASAEEKRAQAYHLMHTDPKAGNPDPAKLKESLALTYPGELKKRGIDLSKVPDDKDALEALKSSLEGDRSGQRSVVNVTLGNKLRDDDAEKGATIPGLQHNPDVRLTPDQAGKVRDAKGEADMLTNSIGKLQGLIRKKGIDINPRDPDYPVMQGMLKDIQLQAKGPAMYQLGVLSGPDMSILEQVTGDPTSWRSVFQGAEGLNSRLETMKQQVGNRLNSKLGAHGYSGGVKPAEPASVDQVQIIKGHKYEKRGGEWYQVD